MGQPRDPMLGRPAIWGAGVHEHVGGIVIDRLGGHGPDPADLIRNGPDLGNSSQSSIRSSEPLELQLGPMHRSFCL